MLNRNQEHSAELRRRVRRSSRGGGVSIALAGLLALGMFAAPAAQAVDTERIVFRRESGGLNQIYVMRASDGFGQTKLSTSGFDEYNPTWSPDATQIAFDSVYEINFFGTFYSNPQVFVTDYIDFQRTNSPSTENFGFIKQNYSPSWSPDGIKLSLVSTKDPDPPSPIPTPEPDEIFGQIITMNATDGSDGVNISANGFNNFDPDWSPDGVPIPNSVPTEFGELIAFTSIRENEAPGNWTTEIYVMLPDGQPFDDGDPDDEDPHDGPKDIQLTTATTAAEINFAPAWSPDGNWIAFTSTRDGNYEIYVMESDGSNQQRLTDDPAFDYGPTWSPDGTQIAFSSDRDQYFQIYAMNADGSDPRNLSNSSTNDYEPSWSPLPVPEPGAAGALATALATLLGLRARRRAAR